MTKQQIKIIIFEGYWKIGDVQRNTDHLFIFGDNNLKIGKGGQAIIRDEWNTAGIPTKKVPRHYLGAYYNDSDYEDNCYRIDKAIANIRKRLITERFKAIVFPEDGLGTGLAKLPKKAPLTYKYLIKEIDKLMKDIGSNNLFKLSKLI